MAEDRKGLGQANPVAATLTPLYAVPSGFQATVANVTVANRTASAVEFRISVAYGGAADSLEQYTHYDVECPGKDTYVTPAMLLDEDDVIRVYAATQDLSFNAFGVETPII